jgi:hypothetical protein
VNSKRKKNQQFLAKNRTSCYSYQMAAVGAMFGRDNTGIEEGRGEKNNLELTVNH